MTTSANLSLWRYMLPLLQGATTIVGIYKLVEPELAVIEETSP